MGKLINFGHYGAIYEDKKYKDRCIKISHFVLTDGKTNEYMY